MRKTFLVLVVFGLGFSVPCVRAQRVPLTSKHRQSLYNLSPDGSQTLTEEVLGTYTRASNGSGLLNLDEYKDGKLIGRKETVLRDAQTGKIYSIYSDRQFGILRQQQALPIRPMHHYFDLHAPQLTINGISFTEISAKRSDGSSSTSCSSDVYDLVVKFDIVFVINGKGFCHTAEYFDIEIGTEPDPSLFVLPAGLKILPDQKPRPESGESATF